MRKKRIKKICEKGTLAVAAVAFGIGVHWLATSSEILIHSVWKGFGHGDPHGQAAVLAGALFLMIASSLVGYKLRHVLGARLKNFHKAIQSPKRCVVTIVSSENFRTGEARLTCPDSDSAPHIWHLDGKPFLDTKKLLADTPDLHSRIKTAVAEADGSHWPWQQLLRGLLPHAARLREVWLVGSPGEKGSYGSLPRLSRFLEQILGPEVSVYIDEPSIITSDYDEITAAAEHSKGTDFENFEATVNRLNELIDRISGERKTNRRHDIVIDTTGGQKTTSIAAAAATLSSDVIYQYTQTSAPYETLAYDTYFESSGGHDH